MHEVLDHGMQPAEVGGQEVRSGQIRHEPAGLLPLAAGDRKKIPLFHKVPISPDQPHSREEAREDQDDETLSYANAHKASWEEWGRDFHPNRRSGKQRADKRRTGSSLKRKRQPVFRQDVI
jgi:hypothetical protein